MNDLSRTQIMRRRLTGGTALALVALFAGAGLAHAQAAQNGQQTTAKSGNDDTTLVIVTGTRRQGTGAWRSRSTTGRPTPV